MTCQGQIGSKYQNTDFNPDSKPMLLIIKPAEFF